MGYVYLLPAWILLSSLYYAAAMNLYVNSKSFRGIIIFAMMLMVGATVGVASVIHGIYITSGGELNVLYPSLAESDVFVSGDKASVMQFLGGVYAIKIAVLTAFIASAIHVWASLEPFIPPFKRVVNPSYPIIQITAAIAAAAVAFVAAFIASIKAAGDPVRISGWCQVEVTQAPTTTMKYLSKILRGDTVSRYIRRPILGIQPGGT